MIFFGIEDDRDPLEDECLEELLEGGATVDRLLDIEVNLEDTLPPLLPAHCLWLELLSQEESS